MGVSGSGKTTFGKQLADLLGYYFLDADDFHSDLAKQQMSLCIPLTDRQREPWISRITKSILRHQKKGRNLVLAYSGLKKHHRNRFRELELDVKFVWLHGSKPQLEERLTTRKGHFAKVDLLASQLSDLEEPDSLDFDMIMLPISLPLEVMEQKTISFLSADSPKTLKEKFYVE